MVGEGDKAVVEIARRLQAHHSLRGVTGIMFKEGDKVLIDKYSGQEVTIEDEEFVILRANEIIALIN